MIKGGSISARLLSVFYVLIELKPSKKLLDIYKSVAGEIMKKSGIFYPILLTAMVFIISCAPPAVKTTMLVPAQYHEASQLKEVAVLPFDGKGGKEFAAEIEGALASINIGDTQYFNLVDRVRLEKIISEMKLSQSALVDVGTAAKVGKLVGAKGIYTGVITESDSVDSSYYEERNRCIRTVTKYDKMGRPYTATEDYLMNRPFMTCDGKIEKYTVSCTKRIATFAFTPKLIEVETGRVVYSNNIRKSADASVCSDSQKPLTSESELLDKAKEPGKQIFRTDIAPYYVTVEIKLMDSDEGITSKDAKTKLEQGIDFAKNNRLDRACELWGEARILSPDSPSLLYNLGICSEVTGQLEQALDLYKKVDRLLSKPDERVNASLTRVQKRINDQMKLK